MADEKEVSPETRYVLDNFEKAGVQVHPNCPKYPGNLITSSNLVKMCSDSQSRSKIPVNPLVYVLRIVKM